MRTGLNRWAAACVPLTLTLFALTACGSEDSGATSPVQGASISATDDSAGSVSSGRGSDENPSRDSGKRGGGVIDETARPGKNPARGSSAQWPVDDVAGVVRQAAAPGTGKAGKVQVTYDARAAAEFADDVRDAAGSWNDRLSDVELRPARAGTRAGIRIVVTDGWPGAYPQGSSLGRGTISIGRKALGEGHDPARVLAHEFGHMLGLPDRQPGSCSSVMSGKSPGISCTNALPSRAEQREVEGNFRSTS